MNIYPNCDKVTYIFTLEVKHSFYDVNWINPKKEGLIPKYSSQIMCYFYFKIAMRINSDKSM